MRNKMLFLMMTALVAGCDLGLDPDSLVRDLRVLAVRTGAADPASVADLDPKSPTLRLEALVAEPSGAGRKVAAPRSLTHDWYFCVPGKSALDLGSVDPACVTFGGSAPDPKQNPALVYLGSGSPTTLNLATLQSLVQSKLGSLIDATMTGTGTLPAALQLQLPVILRVTATPMTADRRDAETAVAFVRIVIPLRPADPAPEGAQNLNPVLQPLVMADDDQGKNAVTLTPCQPPQPCQRVGLRRKQSVYFKGTAAEGSVQNYLPLDQSGRGVIPEVLRYSWFTSDGKFSEVRTGDARPWTRWQADESYQPPPDSKVLSLWLVLQDGRNGTDRAYYEFDYTD